MPQAIERITTLNDSPAYAKELAELENRKRAESDLKAAITRTKEALRADVHHDPKLNDELKQLNYELAVASRAISEQSAACSTALMVASREKCAVMKPQHDSLLRALAIGARDLQQAALTTVQFRNRLDAAGFNLASLPSLNFGEFGLAALEPCSQLSYLVREALSLGVIERSDVPQEWLVRWGM